MLKIKIQKSKTDLKTKFNQKTIDQMAQENELTRLCPICDNLKDWFEGNPSGEKPQKTH
jgi:hypothetical protein